MKAIQTALRNASAELFSNELIGGFFVKKYEKLVELVLSSWRGEI
jgi:hypothetical protein